MTMGNVKKILSKWYIVLLCAIVTSGMVCFEKNKINPSVKQTGDMIYTRTVRFQKVPTYTMGQTTTEIDLSKIMKMVSNQENMMKLLESTFIIKKLDSTVDKMNDINKLKWINKHFYAEKVGPGVYELVMKYEKNEPKDAEYIESNNQALMDAFENCFQNSATLLVDDASLTTVRNYKVLEELSPNVENNFNKKYAFIGFVLGALIGIVTVMVWNVYHEKA